jgi:hypothetical protein
MGDASTPELAVRPPAGVLWLPIREEERRNTLSHAVLEAMALFTQPKDAKMGQNAFQEKRPPKWSGR